MLIAMIDSISEQGSRMEPRQLEELLMALGRGEREALGLLYAAVKGAVYSMALSFLNRAEEAQDVTQDVFVKLWEAAPGYRPQGHPMAWILTITRNEARMKLRERGRVVELAEGEWEAIPADAPSVTSEDRQLLQQAMERLGPEERRIVLLHAVTGLKHREIAQVLGLPLSTVLSKYHRALKKLNTFMKGDGSL